MPKASRPHPQFSWPSQDLKTILRLYHDRVRTVYGAGQYTKSSFIVKRRQQTEVVNKGIVVPQFYGYHLEHLCYITRYFELALDGVIKDYLKETDVPCYEAAAQAIAQTWYYHSSVLAAVEEETSSLPDIWSMSTRICSLDEWVIRERFGLTYAEDEAIEDALSKGYFSKDVIDDWRDLGLYFILTLHIVHHARLICSTRRKCR